MTHKDLLIKANETNNEELANYIGTVQFGVMDGLDIDVPEFGKKIIITGGTNESGLKINQIGYAIGIARRNRLRGREEGWLEVLFIEDGDNAYIYGMPFDYFDFVRDQPPTPPSARESKTNDHDNSRAVFSIP